MKKSKRILILAMATLFLAVSLAGCGAEATTDATPAPSASSESAVPETSGAATEPAAPEKPEPITFTAFTGNEPAFVPIWGEDPVSAKITELTGVTLDIEYSVGNAAEKLGIMLASADYPDMLLSMNNATVAQYADAGALFTFDEYLAAGGGTSIKTVFGDMIGANKSEVDGKTYGFARQFNATPIDPPVNMQVQAAMLKALNYPKISTLDELTEVMKQYKAMAPDEDLVGLLSAGSGWVFNINYNNAALRTAGFQDDGNFYIDPATKEATLGILTPEAKTYFSWLNRLNREGLFDLDGFSLDQNAANEKLATGRVMAVSSPNWFIGAAQASLLEEGKEDRRFVPLPLFVDKAAEENSRTHYYDPNGSWKSLITTNCADPERAMAFFDTMWSEDMQILCNWGVEGINYDVKDGARVIRPADRLAYAADPTYAISTGVGLYNYWSVGDLVKDSSGQFILPFTTPETLTANYTQTDREVLAAYKPDASSYLDLFPTPQKSEWGFAWKLTLPSDSEGAIAESKVNNEIRESAIFQMVTAKDDAAFEQAYQTFVADCEKAGIEKREQEITAALKTRMELWYGK